MTIAEKELKDFGIDDILLELTARVCKDQCDKLRDYKNYDVAGNFTVAYHSVQVTLDELRMFILDYCGNVYREQTYGVYEICRDRISRAEQTCIRIAYGYTEEGGSNERK